MDEEVENCAIIAPIISKKPVLREEKKAKYELSKMEGIKPVEDVVYPNPTVQPEIDAENTFSPINTEQNGCNSPNLLQEELEQNNLPPIIHSDETKESADSLEDLSDQPYVEYCKTVVGKNEYLASVYQEGPTLINAFNELNSLVVTNMAEENENGGQEEAQNNTSDEAELSNTPGEDMVIDTPTNDIQEDFEMTASQIEELMVSEPSASINHQEATTTSSNQNIEEAEAIPPAKEDQEDDEDSSSSDEESERPSTNDKTETVDDDDTETTSGEENTLSSKEVQGRDYYSHYKSFKMRELHTMYPLGKIRLPRGFLLRFRASTQSEIIDMTREYIRDALLPLGAKIAFIDYQKGQLSGWVRFHETCPANKILVQMPRKTLQIGTVDMVFSKVPKHEENKYLNKVGKAMVKLRKDKSSLDKKLKRRGMKIV